MIEIVRAFSQLYQVVKMCVCMCVCVCGGGGVVKVDFCNVSHQNLFTSNKIQVFIDLIFKLSWNGFSPTRKLANRLSVKWAWSNLTIQSNRSIMYLIKFHNIVWLRSRARTLFQTIFLWFSNHLNHYLIWFVYSITSSLCVIIRNLCVCVCVRACERK